MSEEIKSQHLTEDERGLIEEILLEDENELTPLGESRRQFLKMSMLTGGGNKLPGLPKLFSTITMEPV